VEVMSDELVVSLNEKLDHVILRLRGRLTLHSVSQVREAAVKSLLGTGCVLVDLSRLHSSQAAFVTVFPTALASAGGWPLARLVLFGADAAMRSMLMSVRVPYTVPLAADQATATALLRQRPTQVRRRCCLPAHNTAPAAARRFVREACDVWSVPQVVQEIAELVSNELVSNAVDHARSSSRLTVTRTASTLRVSVRDYDPTSFPRPRPIDIGAPRGRGLHLVVALARNWGVHQHRDGKTIWAHLQLDSPE
jgi:anti-sigma regulatory factor (Ser/Thr protein kinase)